MISSGAFSGCTGLVSVTVPPSVTDIAEDAFADCSEDLQFVVTEGSFAEEYAIRNGLGHIPAD